MTNDEHNAIPAQALEPAQRPGATESGELERPIRRRRIDCGGNPEVSDRRPSRGGAGGRRESDPTPR